MYCDLFYGSPTQEKGALLLFPHCVNEGTTQGLENVWEHRLVPTSPFVFCLSASVGVCTPLAAPENSRWPLLLSFSPPLPLLDYSLD